MMGLSWTYEAYMRRGSQSVREAEPPKPKTLLESLQAEYPDVPVANLERVIERVRRGERYDYSAHVEPKPDHSEGITRELIVSCCPDMAWELYDSKERTAQARYELEHMVDED